MTIHDLGDVVALSVQIRDTGGAPANAGDVTLTVVLPDATTTTPAVANPSTGVYTATYTPAAAGRYVARWVATGSNASAFTQDFEVISGVPLITAQHIAAKQRVAVPDPGSVEATALDQAVEQATGLVLAYLRRTSIDAVPAAGIAAVRAVAVRVATRLWRNPTDAASESYGDHSVSWSDPRIFTGDDKTELRTWRKRRARTPIMLTPHTPGDTS